MNDSSAVLRPSAMEGRERVVGLVLTGLAPIAFAVSTIGIEVATPPILLVAALTGMLAAGSALRHRILAGTGAILLSSVLSAALFVVALPYLGYACLLLYRLTKANAEIGRQRAAERRAKRERERPKERNRSEPVVRKGKRGGRVTPPGTPPRPRRR